MRVSPVTEFVGWSVLDGQKISTTLRATSSGPVDAGGDTIVNGKFGVRVGFGQKQGFPQQPPRFDLHRLWPRPDRRALVPRHLPRRIPHVLLNAVYSEARRDRRERDPGAPLGGKLHPC